MRTAYKALIRFEAILAAAFLLLMVGLIFLGGVARMMAMPLIWTIDFATCFFAWAAFLCADIAWRRDALMSIDLFREAAPARLRMVIRYANLAIITVFLVYVIYAGGWLAYVSRARSFQGLPGISFSWVTASLPVGAALLLITTLIKIRRALGEDGLLAPLAPLPGERTAPAGVGDGT
ncbi:TRAP transporter small permease [Acuticoccus kandeliae]|uniref:TRAP transporter small permease n=1 Tax=Acuticoccus kandeliae TaxID=2073160 RepID=UPI000D3E1087|nr:TRAP transporter small permease [Acuticoccus kandeliae]